MSGATPLPEKRRGRQRSAAAQSAILKATMELLHDKPLCQITAEAIADQAQVSKATIYKWWPNKTQVALDAFGACLETKLEIPDTGSAKDDFTRQLQDTIAFYLTPKGRMLCQFLAEGQSDPEFLRMFRERILKPRRDKLRTIWRRGVERGEIRLEVEPELILDLIFGPMVYRLMAGHGPLDAEQGAAIIDTIFRGLQTASIEKPAPKKT